MNLALKLLVLLFQVIHLLVLMLVPTFLTDMPCLTVPMLLDNPLIPLDLGAPRMDHVAVDHVVVVVASLPPPNSSVRLVVKQDTQL